MLDQTEPTSVELQVGDPAPDFTLPTNNDDITLSSLRGQYVVLYFYPADDTPGCTKEACDFRDSSAGLKHAGAVVLGISPDDPKSHRKFVEKYSLPFDLLSDVDHAVAEQYGVWQLKKMMGREFMGVVRSTFLIGPDGRIAHIWPKVTPEGHAGQVLDVLKELQAGAPA